MTTALAWGALAASSLLIGALIGYVRPWPDVLIGVVLAFGAGALISAVSFDLAEILRGPAPGSSASGSGAAGSGAAGSQAAGSGHG